MGGGIQNGGTLTITNSTLSGNKAVYAGGIENSGTLTITNSTLSGNSATGSFRFFGGGGILNWGGKLTITNSTLSGNSAGSQGGGISNFAPVNHITTLWISNSLVIGNNAPYGKEVYNGDETGRIEYSFFTSEGYNLFGENGIAGLEGAVPATNDLILAGQAIAAIAPLNSNGGPTQTHALLAGSPAIDQILYGVNGCGTTITTDQRGVTRPQGANCDIGAYEVAVIDRRL